MQLPRSLWRGNWYSLWKKKRSWEQVLHNRYWTLCGCTARWGDVVLETDSQSKEYFVHSERQTNSRQGDNSRNVRRMKSRIYIWKQRNSRGAQSSECLYREKRPRFMLAPEAPFYVTVHCSKDATIELWMHLEGLLSTQEARVARGVITLLSCLATFRVHP